VTKAIAGNFLPLLPEILRKLVAGPNYQAGLALEDALEEVPGDFPDSVLSHALFAIATWWHGCTTTCGARAGAPCTLVVTKAIAGNFLPLLPEILRKLVAGPNYQAGLALEYAFEKMAGNFPAIAINNSADDPANDAFSTTAAKG